MKITKFEDLPIWQEALRLTKEIYDVTSLGKFARDFSFRDQIRRATISISSNIAEGFEKSNNNEFIRFLRISKGSTGEVRNQLYIALAIGYISKAKFDRLNKDFKELSNQLGGFINYLCGKRSKGEF